MKPSLLEMSCKTCRWCSCRDYGRDFGCCKKYIPDLAEVKRVEEEKGKAEKERRN